MNFTKLPLESIVWCCSKHKARFSFETK